MKETPVDLFALFCKSDTVAGGKDTWNFSGSGVETGKKDFEKFEAEGLNRPSS